MLAGAAHEGRKDAADRLAEAFGAILHAWRLQRETAIPWRDAAVSGVEKAPHQPVNQRDEDRQTDEEHGGAVTGTVSTDRGEQPPAMGRCGTLQAAADEHPRHRIKRADHQVGKQAQQHAAGGKPAQAGALEGIGIVCIGEFFLAWLPQEDDTEELDHGETGQRGDQRHSRCESRQQHVQITVRQAGGKEEALQQQPLGNEAVERWQARRGEDADQRQPGDPGHAVNQTTKLAEIALAGGMQHRTGGQEEQTLEAGVVKTVVQHGGHRQRRKVRQHEGLEGQRETQTDENDPDVFNRRIGQQALHVALDGGVNDAENRRDETDHQQQHAPPPEIVVEQVERDADDAVDGGFQHHAAHQRRNRRGRGRVGFRQPDVQRQQPGLGPETEQREQESHRRPDPVMVEIAHGIEGVIPGATGHDAEGEQDGECADVGDQQVEIAGAADFTVLVFRGDQQEGGKRHGFPGDHEGVAVIGQQDKDHAGEKDMVEQALPPRQRPFAVAEVTGCVDRDAGTGDPQQAEKESRQRIQTQVERQIREAERQNRGLRRRTDAQQRQQGQRQSACGADREEDVTDQRGFSREGQSSEADSQPAKRNQQNTVEQSEFSEHGEGAGQGGSASGAYFTRYLTRIPACAPLSGASRKMPGVCPAGSEAARIMPSLMPNFILRGARLATITVMRPTSCAGS